MGKLISLLFFAIAMTTACRPRTPVKDASDAPQKPLRLEPIRVSARTTERGTVIEAYDAETLFEVAAKHLGQGECAPAIELYDKLISEFPDSRFAAPSLYNSGLCHEQSGHFKEAAANYRKLALDYPDSRDRTDALFRLAASYKQLRDWEEMVRALDALLERKTELEGIEQVEALTKKGWALIRLNRTEEARLPLDEAIALFRTGRGISPSTSTYYYAMARFSIGEILEREMRTVDLPAQESLLEPALERKCQRLLEAQDAYTETIRIAHPHWAAAAAYRIGHLYRGLWEDMVNAPPPEDLSAEEREVYVDVLKEKIHVLLQKAIVQWERTLKMARRLNLSNEWVEKTENELEEIRQILELNDVEEVP